MTMKTCDDYNAKEWGGCKKLKEAPRLAALREIRALRRWARKNAIRDPDLHTFAWFKYDDLLEWAKNRQKKLGGKR